MPSLRLIPQSGPPLEVTKDVTIIGRETTCDLVVADGSVSRRHATIERRGDGWVIIDQASANGTFLDSQRASEAPLKNHQELRLGAIIFKVEIAGTAEPDVEATVLQPVPVVPSAPPAPAAAAPPPPSSLPRSGKAPAPPPPPPPPAAGKPAAASAPPTPPTRPEERPAALASKPAPPSNPPPAPAAGGKIPAAKPAGGEKKKSPLFWGGIACCGCLVILLILGGGGAWWYYSVAAAPVKAVEAQLADIKSGNLDAAYGRLSPTYQAILSREDFERLVQSHPGMRDNAGVNLVPTGIPSTTAVVAGTLVGSSGEREPVRFALMKEGEEWKIAGIEFASDSLTIPNMSPESGP
jgi:pSer/pThr/pTyr-binding forkhead associated (FHA) protein